MHSILRSGSFKNKHNFWHNYFCKIWFRYHTLFFGSLISKGYKIKAFNSFLKIKQGLKLREFFDPSVVFLISLVKIAPDIILLPIRLGGRAYGVPMPITEHKRISLSVRWVLTLLKKKGVSLSISAVIDVLISALYNKGVSIEKKHLIYDLGEHNRHLLKFFK